MGINFLYLIAALLLVLLNAFFVAAEFGLVKLRPTRVLAISKTWGWRGRILARVHGDLDSYLSACQLGITLASLGLGWIGEPAFAELLRPLLALIGLASERLIHGISFFVAFFLISYLHIVVGEQAPKSMSIRMPEAVCIWTAVPLFLFYWAMYPAIWALNHSAIRLLRWVGLNAPAGSESHYSNEELKLILRSRAEELSSHVEEGAERHDEVDEWRVLAQALDFQDLEVADLMRPFSEVVALHAGDPFEKNIERVMQNRYSRYPYLDREGKVAGVIHLKYLFFALYRIRASATHSEEARSPEDWQAELEKLLRPVETVAPRLPAVELFRRFREGAPHFAIVARRDGRPLGFVTLDNLLSALVGEIRDEFRQSQNEWKKLDDGSLLGKGSLPIFTLERALGLDIEEGEADSVGGLIQEKLGDLPQQGQRIEFEGFAIVVKKMRGPKIVLVRVYPQRYSPGN
ncbi:MAG: hemolysin family protein [Betaproteobacteria bacterium]|nr:hemolysin family protein [Betaproteobacteria bacterium]